MPKEFYATYQKAQEAWALAYRAAMLDTENLELLAEVQFHDAFKQGMENALELLTGFEVSPDEYEDTCENAFCNGECNQCYCLSRGDN